MHSGGLVGQRACSQTRCQELHSLLLVDLLVGGHGGGCWVWLRGGGWYGRRASESGRSFTFTCLHMVSHDLRSAGAAVGSRPCGGSMCCRLGGGRDQQVGSPTPPLRFDCLGPSFPCPFELTPAHTNQPAPWHGSQQGARNCARLDHIAGSAAGVDTVALQRAPEGSAEAGLEGAEHGHVFGQGVEEDCLPQSAAHGVAPSPSAHTQRAGTPLRMLPALAKPGAAWMPSLSHVRHRSSRASSCT